MKRDGYLEIFNAFGSYEKRRARIAFRDKQYITSIARWSEIVTVQGNKNTNDSNELNDIIRDLITKRKVKLFEATIEGVIERVWRNYSDSKDYEKIASILDSLKNSIKNIILSESISKKYQFILFRLNNMILQSLNHVGEIEEASDIIREQQKICIDISKDPTYLKTVMDFYLLEIDFDFNNFDFKTCLEKSKRYNKLVENYLDLVEIITESEPSDNIKRSREYLRARMNLIRYILFNSYFLSEKDYKGIISDIEELKNLSLEYNEFHRLLGLKILCIIKAFKQEQLFEIWDEYDKKYLNDFDTYFLLRAINDSRFLGKNNYQKILAEIDTISIEKGLGHPYELIFREKALSYYFEKDIRNAIKCIKKAEKVLEEFSHDSSIVQFQILLLNIHRDFINGHELSNEKFTEILNQYNILSIYKNHNHQIRPFLQLRILSPL